MGDPMKVRFWGTRGTLPVAATSREVRSKIANALLAATHAGEEIAAEARSSAARITAEAETRAAAILGQAAAA